MSDSPRTIYDLGVLLARLEGKVDNLISAETRNETRHKQHEERLAKLERHLFQGLGALGVFASLSWIFPLVKTMGNMP